MWHFLSSFKTIYPRRLLLWWVVNNFINKLFTTYTFNYISLLYTINTRLSCSAGLHTWPTYCIEATINKIEHCILICITLSLSKLIYLGTGDFVSQAKYFWTIDLQWLYDLISSRTARCLQRWWEQTPFS